MEFLRSVGFVCWCISAAVVLFLLVTALLGYIRSRLEARAAAAEAAATPDPAPVECPCYSCRMYSDCRTWFHTRDLPLPDYPCADYLPSDPD